MTLCGLHAFHLIQCAPGSKRLTRMIVVPLIGQSSRWQVHEPLNLSSLFAVASFDLKLSTIRFASTSFEASYAELLQVINVPFRELMDMLADIDRVPWQPVDRGVFVGAMVDGLACQAILQEKLRLDREAQEAEAGLVGQAKPSSIKKRSRAQLSSKQEKKYAS